MRLVSNKNTCRSSLIFSHGTAGFRFVDIHSGKMSFWPLTYHAFCNVNPTWNQCKNWVFYTYNLLSIKTILFDILDLWCKIEEIRFVKSFFETSHVCFIHDNFSVLITTPLDQIQQNLLWKETEAAKPRTNLRRSFWRRDLKKTQLHLKLALKQNFDLYYYKWAGVDTCSFSVSEPGLTLVRFQGSIPDFFKRRFPSGMQSKSR